MGSRYYETPNIDQIANKGMVFTNGYAAYSVCSPLGDSTQDQFYNLKDDPQELTQFGHKISEETRSIKGVVKTNKSRILKNFE